MEGMHQQRRQEEHLQHTCDAWEKEGRLHQEEERNGEAFQLLPGQVQTFQHQQEQERQPHAVVAAVADAGGFFRPSEP